HLVPRCPGAEQERLALALHHGKRNAIAGSKKARQQQTRVDLVPDGREAGDDRAGRDRQKGEAVARKRLAGRGSVPREGLRTAGERPGSLCPLFSSHARKRKMPRWPSKRMIPRGPYEK